MAAYFRLFFVISTVSLSFSLAIIVRAADDPPEPKPPVIVPWIYEIRSLVEEHEDHPLNTSAVPPTRIYKSPTGGSGAYSPRQNQTQQHAEKIEQVVKLLQEMVDPNSWRDNGGQIGATKIVGDQLVITQTLENHKSVAKVLEDFRIKSLRQITIRAQWISLNDEELTAVAPVFAPTSLRIADFAKIDRLPHAGIPRCGGELSCFNGQLSHIAAGRAITVITDITPVVGAGVVGYDAQPSLVVDGPMLEIRPSLTTDNRVVIDITSSVSSWNDMKPAKPSKAATTMPINAEVPGLPDRMDMQIHQLSTSMVIPLGKPIVVGGISATHSAKNEGETRKLFLIIEATTASVN